jgi:hypothetical protein
MNRKEFIRTAATAALVARLGARFARSAPAGEMPYRPLGHTGEKVSLLGIGGYHIGKRNLSEAAAGKGEFEVYKTTDRNDSTSRNPQNLG